MILPDQPIYQSRALQQEAYQLVGFFGNLFAMSLSPDGKLLFAGNSDGKIRVVGLE